MAEYRFKAKSKESRGVEGIVEAATAALAEATLRDRGLLEIALEEAERPGIFEFRIKFFDRVRIKDLVIFARQLAVMEGANVPLVQSLRTISRQTVNKTLKATVLEVAGDVESGTKLSLSLGRHPRIFSDFYVNMIRSGETTGRLDEVLTYLADQQEKDYDLISKIRGAMMYPAFIVAGMLGVGAVMMIFVIPRLTDILTTSGAELPFATKLLIGTSNFLTRYWWLVVAGAVGAVAGFRRYVKTAGGRLYWDSFKVKVPIFGFLFKRIYLVRLTRSLHTLLSGGVDMVPALAVAADVVGNAAYKQIILETKKQVEDGRPIVSVFETRKEIPSMFSQMLSVGEETGKINSVLERLTSFYGREIDNFVANLSTVIEPLIMVVLGGAVGLMVAAIILPMYNLSTQF
ncbi:type II secretion system F family protein [Candidatus Uhrbacteria bacterium]|nr:type II secretion system F family protein [Candidatus Uhrbacteria bacterium]